MKHVVLSLFMMIGCAAFCQVEHNFEMGPEKTDCDKLPKTFQSLDSALFIIKKSTFRLHEYIEISQYRIPNKANFYSCDGSKGYLVVQEDSTKTKIYGAVPIDIWEKFTSTKDPIYYYQEEISKLPALFK